MNDKSIEQGGYGNRVFDFDGICPNCAGKLWKYERLITCEKCGKYILLPKKDVVLADRVKKLLLCGE